MDPRASDGEHSTTASPNWGPATTRCGGRASEVISEASRIRVNSPVQSLILSHSVRGHTGWLSSQAAYIVSPGVAQMFHIMSHYTYRLLLYSPSRLWSLSSAFGTMSPNCSSSIGLLLMTIIRPTKLRFTWSSTEFDRGYPRRRRLPCRTMHSLAVSYNDLRIIPVTRRHT